MSLEGLGKSTQVTATEGSHKHLPTKFWAAAQGGTGEQKHLSAGRVRFPLCFYFLELLVQVSIPGAFFPFLQQQEPAPGARELSPADGCVLV